MEDLIIPKVIHYCWFGGNPLPRLAKKCIASWKKFLPDYEIKEWNESNFDVNICRYTKEAYSVKKFAFVSDYARFWILFHFGGIYFDTDVEVIRNIDDIVQMGPFMGQEFSTSDNLIRIAPGLGIGAIANMPFFKQVLDRYETKQFVLEDGSFDQTSVVEFITSLMVDEESGSLDEIFSSKGILIYPQEYFCPIFPITGMGNLTEKSASIHHYAGSWLPKSKQRKDNFLRIIGPWWCRRLISMKKGLQGLIHKG